MTCAEDLHVVTSTHIPLAKACVTEPGPVRGRGSACTPHTRDLRRGCCFRAGCSAPGAQRARASESVRHGPRAVQRRGPGALPQVRNVRPRRFPGRVLRDVAPSHPRG